MTPALIVRVSDSKSEAGFRDVEGRLVVEGLAITPSITPGLSSDGADRFVLTHIASGKCIPGTRCAKHTEEAAQVVLGAGIDWTVDVDTLIADPRVREVAQELQNRFGYCSRHCDRPEGPSWGVRCQACDWQYDEGDDGSLDVTEAKQVGRDHVCEPLIELSPPESKKWYPAWLVGADGSLRSKASGGAS